MSQYFCPLCKQEVTKALYEKITGVWQEKEKKLADLKVKEKQLLQREKNMQAKFEAEKKKITEQEKSKLKKQLAIQQQSFQKVLQKERDSIAKEKQSIVKTFEKKLASETNKILKQEKARQKELEKTLKEKFEIAAQKSMESEKKKLQKDKNSLQKRERVQMDKYRKLNQQYVSLQSKSGVALEKADKKIKLLEEQIKKNQTPQVLGLLEEGVFLEKLEEMFPGDKFEHPGKGGDIIHYVIDKEKEVGVIVYELKKVATFSKSHIIQTFEAKQKRNADYGILVTNAKRSKDDFGFSVSKNVIIIHPAGALVLVNIIRDHIVRISKLKLSVEKRKQTIQAVLEYIQGPSFRNGIETIIEDTKELYLSLTKEVKDHLKTWELRFNKYRNIHSGAYSIETKVVNLLANEGGKKKLPRVEVIEPIALPAKID